MPTAKPRVARVSGVGEKPKKAVTSAAAGRWVGKEAEKNHGESRGCSAHRGFIGMT